MASRAPRASTRPVTAPTPGTPGPAKPLWLLYLISWLVPGAGHLWLGRRQKGLVFLVALPLMFGIGLALHGRIFPFAAAFDPLVLLAALADLGVGVPRLIAGLAGAGAGDIRALTNEYGNAFLITAGLLNALVIIDAHDIALGRK